MGNDGLENRVRRLERRLVGVSVLCAASVSALMAGAAGWFAPGAKAAEDAKVLRLKGLIIEDPEGRARILIGAPLPIVSERLRKDVVGTDLIFLDEQGHDRFRVGDMLPAAPGFHRVGSAYGVSILDTQGGERGGMGFISNGSNVNRAVVALDRPFNPSVSSEGWAAVVDDATGSAGTFYMYPPGGTHDQEGIFIGTKGEKAQITFKDRNNKERSSFALTNGVPSFELFDETGKSEGDILRKP